MMTEILKKKKIKQDVMYQNYNCNMETKNSFAIFML